MVSNRNKKIKIILSLVILFSVVLMPLAGASDLPVQADALLRVRAAPGASPVGHYSLGDTGDLTVVLEAGEYEVRQVGEYSVIEMENFGSITNPGEPKLPYKTFLVGLPPGAEAVSVDVVASDYLEIPGEYRIIPAPPMVSGQQDEKVRWGENEEIYSSEDAYPSSLYTYLGMGQMRKYNFARVGFCPIAYYPASNRLGLYQTVTIRIKYEIIGLMPPALLADTVMDDVASEIIVNYAPMKSQYRQIAAPLSTSYNYVIITTESLQTAVEPLVTRKTAMGYSVHVVTTSWISVNYAGMDLPEKIRNFLIDKYAEWGIEYVLIVGRHSTIPMRYCYPDPWNHDPNSDSTTPTDYYYADLTGNWDSDGDAYFGEYGDDNVDFYPEVYVGRIPVDDGSMVTSICQKSANFEQDSGSWKKKALLLGAIINYANEYYSVDPKTDGAALMEECWNDILSGNGYSRERMYEAQGLAPSTYAYDHALTNSNVLNPSYGWPAGYGIVNWAAHGDEISAARWVWEWDDGDGIPEGDEMGWHDVISSNDVPYLDNSKPAVVFSDSCLTAYPEDTNNLGKSLLQQGAVAFVGATRDSWGYVGWQNEGDGGCDSIDYYFFYYLINQGLGCGRALYNAQVHVYDSYYWWESSWKDWQNMFDFCLYGDPSLGMSTVVFNNPPNTPSSPSPANHATGISIEADLSWSGGDPDGGDTVIYYVYFGTSATPPLKATIGPYPATQFSISYDPGPLVSGIKYYWKIMAKDNKGAQATGPLWNFTTQGPANNPPYVPSNPSPANHAAGISSNADLGWSGGDPDSGDTVTYDVYFGTSSSPPFKGTIGPYTATQSSISYDPGPLVSGTEYYWKIVATDNHGVPTTGLLWDFTTEPPGQPDIRSPIDSVGFGNVNVGSQLDKTITIYNDGNAILTINSVTRASGSWEFSYIGPATRFNVAPLASEDITIRFTPTSEGLKNAIFNVNSNDPDEANVTFGASGNGVIGGQPDITVFPTSFDVTLPSDTTQDYALTIGNVGGATLTYSISDRQTAGGAEAEISEGSSLMKPASMMLEVPLESKPVELGNTGEAQSGWQNIMTDDFEGAFPGHWDLWVYPDATDAYWGQDNYRAHSGSNSVFCAKGGTAGVKPPANYPNNMEAWLIYGPFDLSDATYVELTFYYWLKSEDGYDYLDWMASTDDITYYYGGWDTGNSGGWVKGGFNLRDVDTLGDLCGEPEVWIAFIFESDGTATDEGAFIDDVVLRKYVPSVNNPPNTPSNPSPANHATGVSGNADLSWTGGDPNAGDTVAYDVYFGTSASPPLVSVDQSWNTYDPGTLGYNTKYYWKVVATDNHAASRTGPVWDFTTESSLPVALYQCTVYEDNGLVGAGKTVAAFVGTETTARDTATTNVNGIAIIEFAVAPGEIGDPVRFEVNGVACTETPDVDVCIEGLQVRLDYTAKGRPWLDENPKSGTVEPGNSAYITVTVNTAGLAEGDYSAQIVISNNDPNGNPKVVPVTLHVRVPAPTVTWGLPWGLDADPAAVNIWTYPGDAVAVTLVDAEWSMPSGLLIWHYGGPGVGWRFYKKGWGATNTLETLMPGKGYIAIVPTASVWEIPQG